MERPRLGLMRRESISGLLHKMAREVGELRAALADCRGDLVAESSVAAALLTHLLLSSRELLKNLLIDTARRPKRLQPFTAGDQSPESSLG